MIRSPGCQSLYFTQFIQMNAFRFQLAWLVSPHNELSQCWMHVGKWGYSSLSVRSVDEQHEINLLLREDTSHYGQEDEDEDFDTVMLSNFLRWGCRTLHVEDKRWVSVIIAACPILWGRSNENLDSIKSWWLHLKRGGFMIDQSLQIGRGSDKKQISIRTTRSSQRERLLVCPASLSYYSRQGVRLYCRHHLRVSLDRCPEKDGHHLTLNRYDTDHLLTAT